jgi:tRNA(adenine34) deaminase
VSLARDEAYMKMALDEARKATENGDIPVGAVMVLHDEVIAAAFNERELTGDPTAHAEILALRRTAQYLRNWRLPNITMYVTLEPCPMCAGAMIQARLGRLVYGAYDLKAGAAGSVVNLLDAPGFNHQVIVKSGVLQEACGELLSSFFEELRDR